MTFLLPDLLGTFIFAGVTTTTVLAAISTVATGVGTYISMQGQKNAAIGVEKTAKYNAKIQRDQGMRENEAAAENVRRKTRENARILGRQRAAIAQSGLAMEGTPLAMLGETSSMLQRDILDMGYDAQNRVNSLQSSASMGLWAGKNQANALRTDALTTGLAGVATASSGLLNSTGWQPKSDASIPKAIVVK